jgi:hypothetical protein
MSKRIAVCDDVGLVLDVGDDLRQRVERQELDARSDRRGVAPPASRIAVSRRPACADRDSE